MSSDARKPRALRIFELFTVAAFTLTTVVTTTFLLFSVQRLNPGTRDFIEYWASGQLLAHHQNPYDLTAVLGLERSAGLPGDAPPLVMGNAPPSLPIIYGLGLVSAKSGVRIWAALLSLCLIVAIQSIRKALGELKAHVWVLAFAFAPALACLTMGQMAMLVLLGLALFLRFYSTQPFLAGVSLWLCLLKPQLFIPFGVVLAVWVWRKRQFPMLVGVLSAIALSLVLSARLDPACWSQYRAMMRVERYDRAAIPCISMALRDLSGGGPFVQYLPTAIACIWAIWYFSRHKNDWDWIKHGSILTLVSLMAAPYSWFVDQCLAVPALMYGLYVTRSRLLIAALAWASVIIETAQLRGISLLHSNFLLWTAPAWLIWYIAATRFRPESLRSPEWVDRSDDETASFHIADTLGAGEVS